MKNYLSFLNKLAVDVEQVYGSDSENVKWFHPYRSSDLEERKEGLLNELSNTINWKFKNTKPFINQISKGCDLCGQGEWSCLFITGICNANCFYCPAKQTSDETPQSQKILFEKPEHYVEYINRFKFKGVAFSGGEPLMVLERTLNFIQQIRQKCDPEIYIWMYTNGILVTNETLKKLGEAGLNEIRFDIGAVNYNPDVLKYASKYIKNVTVEIPAVPEHVNQLIDILPRLIEYGVTNLNLHQLRLTKYNAQKLLKHDYTFLHGEQPSVAESELSAYEIMKFVSDHNLSIGVNYCNFQYKNRFQKAGFRNKMATKLIRTGEELTNNGYLRKIVVGNNRIISFKTLQEEISQHNSICVTYRGRIIENLINNELAEKYDIEGQQYFVEEGIVTLPIVFTGVLISRYISMMLEEGIEIPDHALLFDAWQFEFIENGMREFF